MAESKNDKQIKAHLIMRGTHEVEENCLEGGGCVSFINCRKNPGHTGFIPVYEFSEINVRSWIPNVEQSTVNGIVEYVECCADLVVRIGVPFISSQRPETAADGKTYPFGNKRGQRLNIVGSGFVNQVYGRDDGLNKPCKCGKCPRGTAEENRYWKIEVATARHVVYDDSEARGCKVVFFDDHPDGSGSVTLTGGGGLECADTENDKCLLMYYTHDRVLAQRLEYLCNRRREVLRRWFDLTRMVKKRDYNDLPQSVFTVPSIVISHPHGRMKYITLGHSDPESLTGALRGEPFTYNAATCPGSSGGFVLPLADLCYSFWAKPHSSSLSGNHGCSGGGIFCYC
ncbi:uncharacterized protein LOC101845140 [Aplysia californica]|uniref:Uncharacterized protein LOC101845140 n=1 Tax=Aplysia californica TaxID=6500 RepID=A0ABM1W3C5_APLCA|nr:uncharacterized protein LOC101845140 [Aplysia californica]